MNFENCFPLWNDLNTTQKKIISDNLITQYVKKGTIIHNGNLDCTGLLLVKSGQLRTYILSDEGREITLYRLFDMDMCLLSASCIMQSIQFEVKQINDLCFCLCIAFITDIPEIHQLIFQFCNKPFQLVQKSFRLLLLVKCNSLWMVQASLDLVITVFTVSCCILKLPISKQVKAHFFYIFFP